MPLSVQPLASDSDAPPPRSAGETLLFQLTTLAEPEAAKLLAAEPDANALALLAQLSSSVARALLAHLPPDHRQRLIEAAPPGLRGQWALNVQYPEGSVGRIMQAPTGVIRASATVDDAIRCVRELHGTSMVTYLYATDEDDRLVGVIVLRDLFLARAGQRLHEIMIPSPFFLTPELQVLEAMKQVVTKHYPVYPVCDDEKHLVGLVRGHLLFERQAYVISAQSGTMVGVRVQERLSTHWVRSLGYRHPWLLFNLIVSMLSAAVITLFQDSIRQLVILAIFLPVVSAQARNSGAQTMAVTLRGMTTGEWDNRASLRILLKEAWLGFVNGVVVGFIGGIFIYLQAAHQGSPDATVLAWVLVASMGLGCTVSAVFGVAVPIVLRRMGADPALAAGIILTTIATVASQGLFLSLAVWWVL
jgi:magnesium transporter